MVDNFQLICKHFYFNEANNMFFHCQIVARAKDHKGEKVREGTIKSYFIRSREHLLRVEKEIKLLCEHYKARAYINLAGKDFSTLQTLLLHKLAADVHTGVVRNPRKLLNSAAGELKSRIDRWVVDIDDLNDESKVQQWLTDQGHKNYTIIRVPTVSCCHLLTGKFNTKMFAAEFPHIDVHKNSVGTLLYCPDMNN